MDSETAVVFVLVTILTFLFALREKPRLRHWALRTGVAAIALANASWMAGVGKMTGYFGRWAKWITALASPVFHAAGGLIHILLVLAVMSLIFGFW